MAPRQLIIGSAATSLADPQGAAEQVYPRSWTAFRGGGLKLKIIFFEKLLVVRGLVALTVEIGHGPGRSA
jgi:hypothetical protein